MLAKCLLVFLIVYLLLDSSNGQRDANFFRDDYTYIEKLDSYYKIHTTPSTFEEAKQKCVLEGTTLFYPEDDDEANTVIAFWMGMYPTEGWHYFVGLTDLETKGEFKTIEGKPISDVFNKWESGSPSDNANCVHLLQSGVIHNIGCDLKSPFICKKKDYTYIKAVDSSYKIHTIPRTFAEAKRICDLEKASLFYPENDNEAHAVIDFWNQTQPSIDKVIVGMSDLITEGVFVTIYGKLLCDVYDHWMEGEPNDKVGSEDCIELYRSGYINDIPCSRQYAFICKRPSPTTNLDGLKPKNLFRADYSYIEAEESFYKIHSIPQTWADAKRVCSLEGATFWHPDNDDEARAVMSFWNTTEPHIGKMYVGLADVMAKGLFETVDGKSISEVYNKWQPGQPNNNGGKQDCVYIYNSGLLDDWRCDDKYSFICKKSLHSIQWNSRCNVPDSDYTFNEDNGKCYKLHTTPLNWHDSYAVCRLEQSYLAVVSNLQEANYLGNLTESTPNPRVKQNYQRGIYHVGFHNKINEGWQTVKGTPMNVPADAWWDSYHPADDRDQCGSMFYTGRLINTDCEMKSFFICEHEVVSLCKLLKNV